MTTTIAIFGAGGNMGTRLTNALRGETQYTVLHVEPSDHGQQRLRDGGFEVTGKDEAVRRADVVILAVPDTLIGRVAADVVPQVRSGAIVMCLDPAAPHAGKLP